jgi:hypothetical protein
MRRRIHAQVSPAGESALAGSLRGNSRQPDELDVPGFMTSRGVDRYVPEFPSSGPNTDVPGHRQPCPPRAPPRPGPGLRAIPKWAAGDGDPCCHGGRRAGGMRLDCNRVGGEPIGRPCISLAGAGPDASGRRRHMDGHTSLAEPSNCARRNGQSGRHLHPLNSRPTRARTDSDSLVRECRRRPVGAGRRL